MRVRVETEVAARGPKWSEDEVRVLTAIFFKSQFSIGDDAQEECQLIADCFGRTPGSIDRQWRNIASTLQTPGKSHVGRLIGDCVQEFLNDPAACIGIARATLDRRRWPLHELLEQGNSSDAFQEATDTDLARKLRLRIRQLLPRIDYHIFPSGSHGYSLEVEIDESNRHFHTGITCVLAGSSHGGVVEMKTTQDEIVSQLQHLIDQVVIKQSKTGRLTIHQSGKVTLHGERFAVSIRTNQLVERST